MKTLPLLALAATLAGCSMAPLYQRPDAPIHATYPTGAAYAPAVPGPQSAADIGWRDFFADPLLQQLMETALANNRDLRVAALKVEAARSQYRIQRAELLPGLDLAAGSSAQRTPAGLLPAGAPPSSRSYEVAAVMPSWELDLWGRLRSLNDQALASYLSLEETRIGAQMSLLSEVAAAYLNLRADQALLRLAHDTLLAQQRSHALTRQLTEAGNATALDLHRAEIAVRTAESGHAAYTRAAARDRHALELLLGQPLAPGLAARLAQGGDLPDEMLAADLPAGLPSELLARRPDIRAAEHLLRGANASIGAARAAFFPTVRLTGAAGSASAELDGLFHPGSRSWRFAPQITLPIFRGGALRAGLDLAKVQERIEVARYEKAIQAAFAEVADGLAGARTLDEQARAEEGADDYLAVLDAQRTLYGAQQTLLQTRRARLVNRVALYKALGGGWTEGSVHAVRTASGPAAAKE